MLKNPLRRVAESGTVRVQAPGYGPQTDTLAMIERRKDAWTDKVAGWLAIIVTGMVAIASLTPYVWTVPVANVQLISQSQTTLFNGWMLVLGFYFRTKLDARDRTIEAQAHTAQQQQSTIDKAVAATMPPTHEVQLKEHEKVVVVSEPNGTEHR